MRPLIVLSLALACSIPASATDGFADSFCHEITQADEETVWTVDTGLDTQLDAVNFDSDEEYDFDDTDVRDMVDQMLQNVARRSRAGVRARASTGTCAPFTGSCVKGQTNAQDPNCGGGVGGHAGCTFNGGIICELVLCVDNFATIPFSNVITTLAHEM